MHAGAASAGRAGGAGFRSLRNVEVFAVSGTDGHRPGGRPYGKEDLADAERNFALNSAPGARKPGKPFLKVVCTKGHVPGKPDVFADDPGAPAYGAVTAMKHRGGRLYVDLDGIPPDLADMIDNGQYHAVSLEMYDAPAHPDMPGKGCMARRVAFLGSEPPQVKTLAPLPRTQPGSPARFSERRFDSRRPPMRLCHTRTERLADGLYRTFSERIPMTGVDETAAGTGMDDAAGMGTGGADRDAMLEALAQAGADVSSATDAVPDEFLAEMLRLVEGQPEGQPGADGTATADGAEQFAEPTDAQDAIGKYTMHLDLSKKHAEHAERCKAYAEEQGASVDQPGQPVDIMTQPMGGKKRPGEEDKAASPAMFSERNVRAMIAEAVKDALAGENAQLHKFREESLKTERTKAVDAIVDRLGHAGKLPPSEKADARALMLLFAADPAVHKFSEGGRTVSSTALDRYVATIERRPSLFSEAIPGGGATDPDSQVAEIESHYQSFSEQFRKAGTTVADLVQHYKDARKEEPGLTAASHLLRMAGRRA